MFRGKIKLKFRIHFEEGADLAKECRGGPEVILVEAGVYAFARKEREISQDLFMVEAKLQGRIFFADGCACGSQTRAQMFTERYTLSGKAQPVAELRKGAVGRIAQDHENLRPRKRGSYVFRRSG